MGLGQQIAIIFAASKGHLDDIEVEKIGVFEKALIENIDEQKALSLRVTTHTETPGIGDFIEHRKTKWIKALDGGSFEEWSNLDSVTGATITTSAMLEMATIAFQMEDVFCDIQ